MTATAPSPTKKFAVLCRDATTGKLMGRLTPDGTASRLTMYAAMFNKDYAEKIAAEINDAGEFTAKVIGF